MAHLILTADDFGLCESVNAAVIRAHREGVLTSASLMVTGAAAAEAVALAHANPGLAVGLHLVLARGRAALPPREIPHLVDAAGRFRNSAARAGLVYFFSRAARRELPREIERQLELFAATGLMLSHVDGHMNLHLHPTVLRTLLPMAARFGACGLRLGADDLWLSLRTAPRHAAGTLAAAATFAILSWSARRLARRYGLWTADRVCGLLQSGRMHESHVLELVERLEASSAEIYLHPSLDDSGDGDPNPGDLRTLLSPALRHLLGRCRLELATYSSLGRPER